jgi:hypothetical protein
LPKSFLPKLEPVSRLIIAVCSSWFEKGNFNIIDDFYNKIGSYFYSKYTNQVFKEIKMEIKKGNENVRQDV